jgi:hypothetical protein
LEKNQLESKQKEVQRTVTKIGEEEYIKSDNFTSCKSLEKSSILLNIIEKINNWIATKLFCILYGLILFSQTVHRKIIDF